MFVCNTAFYLRYGMTDGNLSFERNASSSPLLRLPREIRDKIWTEVLGDRLIHFYMERDSSDTESHNNHDYEVDEGPRYEWHQRQSSYTLRHGVCEVDCPDVGTLDSPHESKCYYGNDESLSLTLPRSCSQIYMETDEILWKTNTFAFAQSSQFYYFMMKRNIHQKRLIRKLRFEWFGGRRSWDNLLSMAVLEGISGLRTLRLYITIHVALDEYPEGAFILSPMPECLQRLSTLPLTHVEVIVREYRVDPKTLRIRHFKEETADQIRQMLLDPNGASIYAEAQQFMRRQNQLERQFKSAKKMLKAQKRIMTEQYHHRSRSAEW
ncbi:MAG: hypothetical protein LQ352_005376 [Teloschistes flavicans]|nr:MAG: hypothetical protein LQ352_005376 [Teloschistes flavicans]